MFILFFNATATTEIYTLSLHDALPISANDAADAAAAVSVLADVPAPAPAPAGAAEIAAAAAAALDRKSTRLNSSHVEISYAVFCLKKKKKYCDDIRLRAIASADGA